MLYLLYLWQPLGIQNWWIWRGLPHLENVVKDQNFHGSPRRHCMLLSPYVVLLLLKSICSLRQAAYVFNSILLQIFSNTKFMRSKCMYFAWKTYGLIVRISCDAWAVERKKCYLEANQQMVERIDSGGIGEMKKYISCWINRNEGQSRR